MIITPNTALVTEARNAITAARYPSCRHFWKCDETSGNVLTDAMGRANLIATGGMLFGDGFVTPVVSGGAGTVDGTLDIIGTSPFLFLQVAKATTAGLILGNSAVGDQISLGRAATASTLYDSSVGLDDDMTTPWTTADTTVMARGLIVKSFTGNANTLNYNTSTGAYSAGTETATTNTTQLASQMAAWACGNATTVPELWGAALFKFTTIPSDTELQGILAWCGHYWSQNIMTLPPWLVGRV